MIRRPLATLVSAAALGAAMVLGTAGPAAASPTTVCRQVRLGLQSVAVVCVTYDTGLDGTTVAPYVRIDCTIGDRLACAIDPVFVGRTGFVPGDGGTLGTLYVDGTAIPV